MALSAVIRELVGGRYEREAQDQRSRDDALESLRVRLARGELSESEFLQARSRIAYDQRGPASPKAGSTASWTRRTVASGKRSRV